MSRSSWLLRFSWYCCQGQTFAFVIEICFWDEMRSLTYLWGFDVDKTDAVSRGWRVEIGDVRRGGDIDHDYQHLQHQQGVEQRELPVESRLHAVLIVIELHRRWIIVSAADAVWSRLFRRLRLLLLLLMLYGGWLGYVTIRRVFIAAIARLSLHQGDPASRCVLLMSSARAARI